ncbi:MAG: LPXTG cell wall anchor domain-containing protein, partial [Firmicutes bacterium]|nr:LPXTG cell wall anchor domain-containing protein [Bacillota bacterium]
ILHRTHNNITYYAVIDETTKTIISWSENSTDATKVTSGVDGKLSILGLGKGTFSLEEKTAPAGYNVPSEPFVFTIGGSCDDTTGSLKTLTMSITNKNVASYTADSNTGIVYMAINNTAGKELPETGGMGTTLFTIGGLILMAGAAALLMARKKTEN